VVAGTGILEMGEGRGESGGEKGGREGGGSREGRGWKYGKR